MHADLSRVTFRAERHYSAVLAQQGRVQLDADANEQTAIQLHQARTAAADLIGQHGGPSGATGFAITFMGGSRELDDLTIGAGRYYVDGILLDATRPQPAAAVEDTGADDDAEGGGTGTGTGGSSDRGEGHTPVAPPATWTYWDQPDAYRDPERHADRLPDGFPYLAYLKVWERVVTAAEDPSLREVALGSAIADTAARAKTVWQVLPLPASELGLGDESLSKDEVRAAFAKWAAKAGAPTSRLAARSRRPVNADDDPCLVSPEARYRGPENQLYRVEIHEGGAVADATFKWSRENGSVTFPVYELDGTWVELASIGADDKLDLNVGDQVEFTDTAYTSRGEPLPLLRVEELDLPRRRVRLSGEPEPTVGRRPELHPFLRRWDQRSGGRPHGRGAAARLRNGAVGVEEGRWLPLEDGVEVYFAPGGGYRSGDFWLVAARTATGEVEWPTDAARRPLLQAPLGIEVHYAPLAWVMGEQAPSDLRLAFGPLATAVPAADAATLAEEERARAEESAADEHAGAAPGGGTGEAGEAGEEKPAGGQS